VRSVTLSGYLRRRAHFGVTRKKTGWDSGRHLEIMASGAVPYFVDLDALPPRTLAMYPRAALRQVARHRPFRRASA
jgi:hypothetical protein